MVVSEPTRPASVTKKSVPLVNPTRHGLHQEAMALLGEHVEHDVRRHLDVAVHGVVAQDDVVVPRHGAGGDETSCTIADGRRRHAAHGLFRLRPPIPVEFDARAL